MTKLDFQIDVYKTSNNNIIGKVGNSTSPFFTQLIFKVKELCQLEEVVKKSLKEHLKNTKSVKIGEITFHTKNKGNH